MIQDPETGIAFSLKATHENFITVNGFLTRYLSAGRGESLLLIHTMRTQSEYFHKIIPALAEKYHVYAIDLPGHGGSSFQPGISYTESFFRDHVREFMDVLNLKNVIVAGESFGGTIALTLAATDRNKRIQRVVAFNPYDYGKWGGIRRSSKTAFIVFTAVQLPLLGSLISRSETDGILKKIIQGGLNEKLHLSDTFLKKISDTRKHKCFPKAFQSMAKHWRSWISARILYASISAPVDLVYSENDWSTPVERDSNRKSIAGCQYHLLKNTGHFSCIENPLEVVKVILNKSLRNN